jgi:hypothetical protein
LLPKLTVKTLVILLLLIIVQSLRLDGGPTAGQGQGPILIDHQCTKLSKIPAEWIEKAKATKHIAYGYTSHGSQIATGMTGLVQWKGRLYAWNIGGTDGALDLRGYAGNFGGLGIANDLGADINGNLNRTSWEKATRLYLKQNPAINVIVWAWCWQVYGTEQEIDLYLKLMNKLEADYPNVRFVYMTGRLVGQGKDDIVNLRNEQIRAFCRTHGKVLYDFADIESYDPDGVYYGDKLANDACDYDSNGDGTRDRNWAVDWQNAHPGEWFACPAEHSQPLNANQKAYAAWWLWARLAGWDGRTGDPAN